MVEELPEFKAFLIYEFQNNKIEFVVKSQTKAFPLKKIVEELFSPQYCNNKDSTTILDTQGTIAVNTMIMEIKDKTKATYKYLSISGTDYSWDHCPVIKDLTESSFANVDYQVHIYGWISMCNAAAISDMSRNRYVYRPTSKNDLKEGNRGMFHDFPEELKLTAITKSMEDTPVTHKAKNRSIDIQRDRRR